MGGEKVKGQHEQEENLTQERNKSLIMELVSSNYYYGHYCC